MLVAVRRLTRQPWHSPPHRDARHRLTYIFTAACYEHKPIIGVSAKRLSECEEQLLNICEMTGGTLYAWTILPNHYHLLLQTDRIREFRSEIGRFHGRSSFVWNGQDKTRGRQVWFNCFERPMKSERHFQVSRNYIHHNAVRHGYVEQWQDWPWSSAAEFIAEYGRQHVMELWREYPILEYGKKWDTR